MYVCLPSCSDRTQNTRFSSLPRDSLHGWKNLISENRHDIASFHSGLWTSPLKSKLLEFWKVSLQVMAAESEEVGVTNRLNETPRHFAFGPTMPTVKRPTLRKAKVPKKSTSFCNCDVGNSESSLIFSALAFWDVDLSDVGLSSVGIVGPSHTLILYAVKDTGTQISTFLPPPSAPPTPQWCFLLLINMKTHKTFDGVENHRRCFLCLKWASGSGRRKEWKARRERWKQKFNDNSPDLNV